MFLERRLTLTGNQPIQSVGLLTRVTCWEDINWFVLFWFGILFVCFSVIDNWPINRCNKSRSHIFLLSLLFVIQADRVTQTNRDVNHARLRCDVVALVIQIKRVFWEERGGLFSSTIQMTGNAVKESDSNFGVVFFF